MKIFFEEYAYKLNDIEKYLDNSLYSTFRSKENVTMAKIDYVGYFFNVASKEEDEYYSDAYFILPKVFLNAKGEPFELKGKKPEDVIEIDKLNEESLNNTDVKEMIYNLSIWIYKAIDFYLDRSEGNSLIGKNGSVLDVISNKGDNSSTYLDIVLKLIRFNKEHRSLFTFIKIINSSGNRKIDWNKTISSIQPLFKKGKPVYVEFKNKQKVINYDEELIVLFYSVLNYLQIKFPFKFELNINYNLLSVGKIESLIESGKGTRYLKSIRRKYFTDELVALWELLRVFFEKSENVAAHKYPNEALLAKSFDRVFEDMIDYIVSDDIYPKELKDQKDKKFVDHLYKDSSLIYSDNIYYVGDSKYYTPGSSLDIVSIAKQYTYAKNIIQYNINVWEGFNAQKDRSQKSYFQYRDEMTEGYNITPNYFIASTTRMKGQPGHTKMYYDFNDIQLENATNDQKLQMHFVNKHFENRLFDRDTLILQYYNINFLFILSCYAVRNEGIRNSTRYLLRDQLKKDLTEVLNNIYDVYQVCLARNENMEEFVHRNFWELSGRIFSFSNNKNEPNILLYAEEKQKAQVIAEESYFVLKLKNGETINLVKEYIGNTITKKYRIERHSYNIPDEDNYLSIAAEDVIDNYGVIPEGKKDEYIPLYDVKGGCGYFVEQEKPEAEGWIKATGYGFRSNPEDFIVVYAVGDSMQDKIQDGDLCIFRKYKDIPDDGRIVLSEISGKDDDYQCAYTIKKFYSVKDENGNVSKVILKPENKEYNEIEINEETDKNYKVIAVYENKLRFNKKELDQYRKQKR